ncbi:aspartic peptidase domain-containing protein [Desarmillaria tabescens]|uniref:Aspartic peptidase domain-containing protein n=1 Tax=Armillaria tabescens TaxID=1929756 RepID=A0AA39JYR6_ARMTA|nr:aspartic peptidase domain-containing protein [Desarmillaria tabescens]KAK0451304.1 aspartic peptidase domain-containing protein [Desarmillaria tabescens]
MRRGLLVLSIQLLSVLAFADIQKLSARHAVRTNGGIHVPIFRKESASRSLLKKRGELSGAIGLGDYFDVTYHVLVTIGNTSTPLVLDTGSSDLWAISDACTSESCMTEVSLYPQTNFTSTGLEAQLFYGDSRTGTYALGIIGQDTVSLAGLCLDGQYFAAINDTNTSVLDTGAAGIFGLGFPSNSFIWSDVFFNKHASLSQHRRRDVLPARSRPRRQGNFGTRFLPRLNSMPPVFPAIANRIGSQRRQSRLNSSAAEWTSVITDSYASMGPFVVRLVAKAELNAPMFTVTLQRNTISREGNVGQLSIGELPAGIKNESLTWVPIRSYSSKEGGLVGPTDSPNEKYPINWEIFIDAVYLDGQKLNNSSLASSDIAVSGLVDTGNTLVRGPSDVIDVIYAQLGGTEFSCSTPHTLAFQIGGKMFPVDPRDFIVQAHADNVDICTANIAATDTPVLGEGPLYSWCLGDPFLKGVLSAFHYGNLSYPSVDSPRIGLLSTVPEDASDKLIEAVREASSSDNLYGTAESAPTGLPVADSTNSLGVPVVTAIPTPTSSNGDVVLSCQIQGWLALLLGTVVVLLRP